MEVCPRGSIPGKCPSYGSSLNLPGCQHCTRQTPCLPAFLGRHGHGSVHWSFAHAQDKPGRESQIWASSWGCGGAQPQRHHQCGPRGRGDNPGRPPFDAFPLHTTVLVIGPVGSGKSALINSILGEKACETSATSACTRKVGSAVN